MLQERNVVPDQGFHPGFACDRSGACASTCAATTSKTPKEYAERRRDCEKVQYAEAIRPPPPEVTAEWELEKLRAMFLKRKHQEKQTRQVGVTSRKRGEGRARGVAGSKKCGAARTLCAMTLRNEDDVMLVNL